MTGVLTLDEMLAVLRLSRRAWKDRKRGLYAAGFPQRLPGLGHRWSHAAVRAWVDGRHSPAPMPDAESDVDARLAARGAAIADEAAHRRRMH